MICPLTCRPAHRFYKFSDRLPILAVPSSFGRVTNKRGTRPPWYLIPAC
jgi:hypothetical protein